MKTQITAILIACGALLASASTANAAFHGSQACLFSWTPKANICFAPADSRRAEAEIEIDTTEFVQFDTAAIRGTAPTDEPPVLASTEFGGCLLNDAPVDIETLVDCRSDACLGRKGYYGSGYYGSGGTVQ